MCGRYTLTKQEGVVEEMQAAMAFELAPRFNVAPTQQAPVVIQRERRTIEMFRWGLLPKSQKKPPLMINVRSEGMMDRPLFRDSFRERRCLVPADGFFEWKAKHPVWFHPTPRRVFAFAGIWLHESFAILTGPPSPLVAPIHDRTPVIIDPEDYATWLTGDADAARALIHRQPLDGWAADFVSQRVNSAANDDPACIAPDPQGALL